MRTASEVVVVIRFSISHLSSNNPNMEPCLTCTAGVIMYVVHPPLFFEQSLDGTPRFFF